MTENKRNKPLTLSELKSYGMALLTRREYGAHELLTKLQSKAEGDDAEQVLHWLQEQKLQSDQRYAEMLLRSKSARGQGPQRIRQEMQQKRLNGDAINLAFENYEGDWFEQAVNTYRKKFSATAITDPKERAKRQRFMLYRGYTSDQISHALAHGHEECTNF
ncbi:MAG: recombination regulator RecX [Pseudomonadales bacterium]|nr:recombination regulator RecX [Pseudomonadales bacterium]